MKIFDDGLEHMQKISQVEPLLLPNLIKTGKNGIPLQTIKRPKVGRLLPKMKDEIKEECNEIWNSNTIFNFDIKKHLRLQEFKSKQKPILI